MSAQCWCFTCGGKVVSRNTFLRHGRKVKPDLPVQKRNVELLSVPEERPDFKNDQGDLPLPAPDEEDCELENAVARGQHSLQAPSRSPPFQP